jgi:hypothetical protein
MATMTRVDALGNLSTLGKLRVWTRFRKSPSTRIPNPADFLRVDVWTVWTPYRGGGRASTRRAPTTPGGGVMRRPQPRATGRVVDLTRDPMAPPELVTQAILDGLDETARQMEHKWGVDRLRLLVSDFLRMKFDAQKAKLDAAIATDQEVYVRAQAEGMRRAPGRRSTGPPLRAAPSPSRPRSGSACCPRAARSSASSAPKPRLTTWPARARSGRSPRSAC